jgi:hypothetical protein
MPTQNHDKRLDFWDEALRLFGVAPRGQHIDVAIGEHREMNFKPRGVALDHANRVEGDLSLVYTPADADMQPNFGFVAGLWGERWDLSPDMRLHLSVNVQDTANAPWAIRLIDGNGLEALGRLPEIKSVGKWQDLVLPLAMLEVPAGYDWRNSKLCEFEAAFGNKARIHLDAVRFEGGETVIGVTDKSLTQRRAEAHASRATRIETAFRKSMADESAPVNRVVGAFARMMLDEDLETANQLLVRELKESSDANVWSLLHTPLYCRFYFHFSNRCGKYPGRMTRETEALLLETLWDRTAVKNDIALARQSTWWPATWSPPAFS